MKVLLPDGTALELADGATGADSRGRDRRGPGAGGAGRAGRTARCATCRLRSADGERVEILTERTDGALDLIRHDAAHVMATAVMELYPGTKVSIGPPIEDGFYYDFEFPEGVKVTDQDLARIEERHARARQGRRAVRAHRRCPSRRPSATSRSRARTTRSS